MCIFEKKITIKPNVMTKQEKVLQILFKLGFRTDFKYSFYSDDEIEYNLSKQDGTGKIYATVFPDGSVNGIDMSNYISLL
jgi:hypothetical protein